MRFDCGVDLDVSDTVRIGFRPTAGGVWNWSDWHDGDPVEIVLYNFLPGTTYEYKVEVASGPFTSPTTLTGGPSLPTLLDDLNLQISKSGSAHANYVMFDTRDCQLTNNYLVVVDTGAAAVVWYQDVPATTVGTVLTGWSYTPDETILAVVDRGTVYEWALDGSEVHSPVTDFYADCGMASGDNGPCPHHDAFRSAFSGKTYMLTGTLDESILPTDTSDYQSPSACDTWNGFVDDGYRAYNSDFSSYTDHTLMGDMGYDPATDGGPNPTDCLSYYWGSFGFDSTKQGVDWTHANSVSSVLSGAAERVTLSLRQWSQVVRYNPNTGNVLWRLNGLDSAYSDFTIANGPGIVVGDTDFGGQHHVTEADGMFLMFDNRTGCPGSFRARAIQVDVDTSTWAAAIMRGWEMRAPGTHIGLRCDALGSAVIVPGTSGQHVLANCGPMTVIQEIDEYDGQRTMDPQLQIALDSTPDPYGQYDLCKTLTDPTGKNQFYRAWPLLSLGEF